MENTEKPASFKVNHLNLKTGLYLSRVDYAEGKPITTFDLRYTRPNLEEPMDTKSVHALEHLGAAFLRRHKMKDRIIYFGPMGCRTGFYLIVSGKVTPADILPLVKEMNEAVIAWEGDIPGATPRECGNYADTDREGAKRYCRKYYEEFLKDPKPDRMIYP